MNEKISFLRKLLVQCQQLLNKLINTQMHPSLLDFCNAIKEHEGTIPPCRDYPNGSTAWRNKNPGNLKCVPIMNRLAMGIDPVGFCIFTDEAVGFRALLNKVQNAIDGKSEVYKPNMTLYDFFAKYDATAPKIYAEVVGKKLGVDPAHFTIKELI